jgi:Trypsin-co-occurring domain 1
MTQVGYMLDDGMVVRFEVDPGPGFRPAGAEEVVGRLAEAAAPVVAGAKVLLEQVRASQPDEVEVKFGVKVTGTANWLIAKAASEGNFEVTLTWKADQARS